MKITYCITVCDEVHEFKKLYETLRINKQEGDNILVLVDENKCPRYSEFHDFLEELYLSKHVTTIFDKFQGNFSEWKNKLRTHFKADGDYLVFLDADELLPPQLIDDLPSILELNPEVDVFGLPRQNFVKGITPEDIKNWGWIMDEQNRINFPDVQFRIMKNKPGIEWKGQVHETLICPGIKTTLPLENQFAILHFKKIEKQRKQNESYQTGNYSK